MNDVASWEAEAETGAVTPEASSALASWEVATPAKATPVKATAKDVKAATTTTTTTATAPDPYAQDFNAPQQEIATGDTKAVRNAGQSAAVAEMLKNGKTDDEIDAYVKSIGGQPIDRKLSSQWREFLKIHAGATPAVDVIKEEHNSWLNKVNANPAMETLAAFGNAAAGGAPAQLNPQDFEAMSEAHPVASLLGDLGGSAAGALLGEALVAKAGLKALPAVGDALYGAVRGGVENPDDPLTGALGGAALAGAGGAVVHAAPAKVKFGSDEPTVIPGSEGLVDAPTSSADATTSAPVETSPVPMHEDVMNRLTTAIDGAAKIEAKVQRRLYSEERKTRLAKATAARKAIGGEEGLNASLSALKGELPKAEFEGVRSQFSDEEIGSLFDHINQSPKLQGFEPINAQIGLRKLLDGQLPTASEIKVMDRVFPPDFLKTALKHRSFLDKASEVGSNLLNLPRSMKSTFDLSAPFTQGVFMVGRKEFWQSFSSMFKAFGSEKSYNDIMEGVRSNANYPWMEEAKLALTDIHGPLSQREEQFMSNYAEKIPVMGHVVKASDRAYTAFLNKLRADSFSSILEKYKVSGIDINDDPKLISDLGKFINNATGRGDLGKHGNAAAPLLSGLLFSPRLMAARVNMLRPDVYVRMHPEVRKEALKSLLSFGGITTTALSLAAAGGASVETDPRSSDFAKIKTGNTRYNVLGGFGPYLTLAARMATGEKKTIKGSVVPLDGKKFGSSTRLGVSGDFLRSKFSPVVGFAADWADGKNVVGEPFSAKKETLDLFTPMFLADAYQLMHDNGPVGAAMAVPSLFGVGAQTFDANKKPGQAQVVVSPTSSISPTSSEAESAKPTTEASWDAAPKTADASWEEDKSSIEPSAVEANDAVTSLLEERGITITDHGIRSNKEQKRLASKYSGVAKPGTSRHEEGKAIDIAPPSDISAEELENELSDAGLTGVKIITKRHGSGPHWHIQWSGLA